jgi:hypothetical protein
MSAGERSKELSVRRAALFAWPTFKKHVGLLAAIVLTFVAAWALLEVLVIAGQRFGILLWAVAHLAFLIVCAGLQLGLLRVCLDLYDGGQPRFRDALGQLAMGPRFLAGEVLYLLMVGTGIVLMVVPGLCVTARYSLFGLSIASGERSLLRSFQHSAALTAGVRIRFAAVCFALLILNVLGISLLGVGLLVTIPVSALIMTAVYRQLDAH